MQDFFGLTGLRISGGRMRELARVDDRPLQPRWRGARRSSARPSARACW